MTWYQILSLIGCPALIGGLWKWVSVQLKSVEQRNNAVQKGVQALLRGQMIKEYNHYLQKGYAPIYAKENFENMWMQYHNLGANGVMDDIHEKFKALPTEK